MVVESRPARNGEPLRGGRGTVGRGSGKASASARSGSDPRRGTARGGAAGEGRGGSAAQRGTARGGVAGEGRPGESSARGRARCGGRQPRRRGERPVVWAGSGLRSAHAAGCGEEATHELLLHYRSRDLYCNSIICFKQP